jgi:DNA-binding CsgD family transcriptional regulator
MPWRVDAARACMRLERLDEARELLDEHELRAQRWGTPAGIGAALAARAAMATGPEQVALLQEAEELLEQSPRRLEHGRVQLELGIALRRNGQRREAERLLAKTVSLARACGATALAVRANDELGVLTARPRRLQFSGAESLTASERRVALMAAEGLPSARIAQSLFVTVKTVENHLGRVYIKLAINSRGQLAAALGLSGAADEAVTVRP